MNWPANMSFLPSIQRKSLLEGLSLIWTGPVTLAVNTTCSHKRDVLGLCDISALEIALRGKLHLKNPYPIQILDVYVHEVIDWLSTRKGTVLIQGIARVSLLIRAPTSDFPPASQHSTQSVRMSDDNTQYKTSTYQEKYPNRGFHPTLENGIHR